MEKNCCVNIENVKKVRNELTEDLAIVDMAEIFKLLGDPSRLKIVMALRIKELCVGDLSALMEISQSGVSHQLSLLKKNRIVQSRREGKMIYYALDDEHIDQVLDVCYVHVKHKNSSFDL